MIVDSEESPVADPTLSVIMPVYNEAASIEAIVAKVLASGSRSETSESTATGIAPTEGRVRPCGPACSIATPTPW